MIYCTRSLLFSIIKYYNIWYWIIFPKINNESCPWPFIALDWSSSIMLKSSNLLPVMHDQRDVSRYIVLPNQYDLVKGKYSGLGSP